MSLSRGLFPILGHLRTTRSLRSRQPCRLLSSFVDHATNSANKTQTYISRTNDPYLNLSIEHFLLQKTPPHSTVLFLYTDRPCVVIGRNQNPWIEVNLPLLRNARLRNHQSRVEERDVVVDLVRRRSGGGTVFHDLGNVNYSVICPTEVFDRDRHAEMVVRALRRLGVGNASVNERHDIVLAGTEGQTKTGKPFKISGSAYKLTRLRSVHHGTCLLNSPNITSIGQYLRSPAKPYVKARGVDSVSSPITNVGVETEAFEKAVVHEFGEMYAHTESRIVGDEEAKVPEIAKGFNELKSLDWTFLQTPQFTFSTHETEDDPRPRQALPEGVPQDTKLSFDARYGAITEVKFKDEAAREWKDRDERAHTKVHELTDWHDIVPQSPDVAKWLGTLFGR